MGSGIRQHGAMTPAHRIRLALVTALVLAACQFAGSAPAADEQPFRVGYEGEIFVVERDGDRAHRITPGGNTHKSPEWAPGGRRLATLTNFDIAIRARRDGHVIRRFEGDPYHVSPASWSPDGRQLAFVAYDSIRGDGFNGPLTVRAVAGSGNRTLARNASSGPDWSPDGSRLYYLHGREKNFDRLKPREIRSVRPRSGDVRSLVANVVDFAGVSQDGRWLLFTRYAMDHGQTFDLWIARADGSDERLLFRGLKHKAVYGWAPGDRGVYVYRPGISRHPWVVSTSGERRQLGVELRGRRLAWSPDGRWIAHDIVRFPEPTLIRASRPSGADERTLMRVAARSRAHVDGLTWSPTSRHLAVEAIRLPGS
jgi:Tol biopolymer transport system component